jgi:hypothetical protein
VFCIKNEDFINKFKPESDSYKMLLKMAIIKEKAIKEIILKSGSVM